MRLKLQVSEKGRYTYEADSQYLLEIIIHEDDQPPGLQPSLEAVLLEGSVYS